MKLSGGRCLPVRSSGLLGPAAAAR